MVLRSSTSSEDDATAEYDIAALLNDLQESTDRERDLQSQLQLVEEEGEVLRKSLADVEQEKETIDFELERYKMRFGTLDDPKKSEKEKGVTSEKEAELRLQLMVIEQEATVMRRKLVEKEVKNEELEGALARLSERLPDEDDGGESSFMKYFSLLLVQLVLTHLRKVSNCICQSLCQSKSENMIARVHPMYMA